MYLTHWSTLNRVLILQLNRMVLVNYIVCYSYLTPCFYIIEELNLYRTLF